MTAEGSMITCQFYKYLLVSLHVYTFAASVYVVEQAVSNVPQEASQ